MVLIANGNPSDAGHVAHSLGGALLGQIRNSKPDQIISACRNMLYELLRMLLPGLRSKYFLDRSYGMPVHPFFFM